MIKNGCGGSGSARAVHCYKRAAWPEDYENIMNRIFSFTSSQSVSQKSLSAITLIVVFSVCRCSFVYYHYDYYDYDYYDYYYYNFTILAPLLYTISVYHIRREQKLADKAPSDAISVRHPRATLSQPSLYYYNIYILPSCSSTGVRGFLIKKKKCKKEYETDFLP